MNNLDFSAEPLFSWYVVLLALSGAIMVALGVAAGGLKVGLRILNLVLGLAFLGYAYYLAFVFEGGTYTIFFKAFILPVGMIVASVKALVERSNAKKQPAQAAAPFDPNAPQGAFNPNAPFNPNAAQQAPFNPNAPQAPYAAQPGAPVPPPAGAPVPPAPAPGASPYQPGVPPQPVADNPYAQPQPPQHPAG
ncbi:hypothetical protein [Kitasatospora sp. SC0581]|uniref:hypothetical protein n=1 Tax=Kitasatospora sp. SC0581 TaxID=3394360 RepID=UPI003A84F3C4